MNDKLLHRKKELVLSDADFYALTGYSAQGFNGLNDEEADKILARLEKLNRDIGSLRVREQDYFGASAPLSHWMGLRVPGTQSVLYRDLVHPDVNIEHVIHAPHDFIR